MSLTDTRGQLVEQYRYDAFGTPTILAPDGQVRATSIVGNRFLFTGREYDQETGLYYMRRRYYDPRIGRFISRDPLTWGPNDPRVLAGNSVDNNSHALLAMRYSPALQSVPLPVSSVLKRAVLLADASDPLRLMPYLYVANNPLSWVDPFGLDKLREQFYIDPHTGTIFPVGTGPRAPLPSSANILAEQYVRTYLNTAGLLLGVGGVTTGSFALGVGSTGIAGLNTLLAIRGFRQGTASGMDVAVAAAGALPGKTGIIASLVEIYLDISRNR